MSSNFILVSVFVISGLIIGGIGITIYVLRAIGLYKLAKNSQIRNP